jgi:hypothetical protein
MLIDYLDRRFLPFVAAFDESPASTNLNRESPMSTFVRIYKKAEGGRPLREILVNVGHISKIEVEYVVPSGMPERSRYQGTSVEAGQEDENAVRIYNIHVGGEVFVLESNPNDPVLKIIDDIYKAAVKG